MKVLHCPTDVGGNPWCLSRAERMLGIQSDVVVFKSTWLKYPADKRLYFEKKHFISRELSRLRFFKQAIEEYDVFHFNFGRSIIDYPFSGFFNHIDLPLLKKMGKKIVVTFQGCDARIKSFCIKNFKISACAECDVWYCNFILDQFKKKRIQKVLKYADQVFVLNPDLLHVVPDAEFLPYCADTHRLTKLQKNKNKIVNEENKNTITILHAPTSRAIKGTKYLLQACKKLRENGYNIELQLIEKTSHEKAIRMYLDADIVVDQLLVGWYGAFAVEVMALGKPVICYLREEDLNFLPFKDKIPIINATPFNIYDVLKNIIDEFNNLSRISKLCKRYVRFVHDPIKIAKRVIKAYRS